MNIVLLILLIAVLAVQIGFMIWLMMLPVGYYDDESKVKINSRNSYIKESGGSMTELKDIVLKKGDIVVFKNKTEKLIMNEDVIAPQYFNIFEIKRPVKYKVIYEAPKQILDKEEKEYLENVIRPFKEYKQIIKKVIGFYTQYITIDLVTQSDTIHIPIMESGMKFRGMELNKEYTLKELGLFEE